MSLQAFTAPWPEGVIARYLTVSGAHIDITKPWNDYRAVCDGCAKGYSCSFENPARDWAQAHAETCRALPRPTGGGAW